MSAIVAPSEERADRMADSGSLMIFICGLIEQQEIITMHTRHELQIKDKDKEARCNAIRSNNIIQAKGKDGEKREVPRGGRQNLPKMRVNIFKEMTF